jgi:hypothetical protein
MPGAGKDLDFPRDDLAECNRTGTGLCTFPEITLGISFADFGDERGFFFGSRGGVSPGVEKRLSGRDENFNRVERLGPTRHRARRVIIISVGPAHSSADRWRIRIKFWRERRVSATFPPALCGENRKIKIINPATRSPPSAFLRSLTRTVWLRSLSAPRATCFGGFFFEPANPLSAR